MQLDEALAPLPVDSPYREAIRGFASTDPALRAAGSKTLHSLSRPYWEDPIALPEPTAVAVLRAALELEFPPREDPDDEGQEALVFSLIGSGHPAVLDLVEAHYAVADQPMRRDMLTVVASAATHRGAALFTTLVARHGWPEETHRRLMVELGKNVPHAEALFPALLAVDAAPAIDVGNLLLVSLRRGTLPPVAVEDTRVVRELATRIRALADRLVVVRARPRDERSDEENNVERELAMELDLAGFVGGSDVTDVVGELVSLPESWPAAFAIASRLRRGGDVAEADIERVGSDPSVRGALYSLLKELGAVERIPERLRGRDAFAEADMVGWLSHPGELGRPPDAIEKMAMFEASGDAGPVVLYVWRFRVRDEPWKASVSGPYAAASPEGPIHSSGTFSRFEDWESATAEEHANAILENLAAWRRAWAR